VDTSTRNVSFILNPANETIEVTRTVPFSLITEKEMLTLFENTDLEDKSQGVPAYNIGKIIRKLFYDKKSDLFEFFTEIYLNNKRIH
jgi:hypothetical protein